MAGNTSMNDRGGGRTPEPMDFEQLLRCEMAIDPSAEFLPRVRERLNVESSSARWHWRWLLSVGALATTATAIFAVSLLRTAPIAAPPAPRVEMGGAIALLPARPVLTHRVEPHQRQVRRAADAVAASATVASATAEPPLPQVIVDQRQLAALSMLIRIIRDGKLTDESFAQTTPVNLEAIREQVTPVHVGPMTVSPIPVGGVLQSESR